MAAVGRTTRCDACRRVKPDCRWTLRVTSGMRYVLCAACCGYWMRCGHELRNIDEDFPDPPSGDELVRLVADAMLDERAKPGRASERRTE